MGAESTKPLLDVIAEIIADEHSRSTSPGWYQRAAEKVLTQVNRHINERIQDAQNTVQPAPSLCEERYPTIHKAFIECQQAQLELFENKMIDYGTGNIALGATLDNPDDIQFALTGLYFRINDKINRLKQLVAKKQQAQVKDESVRDTFQDLANYGTIAQIVLDGQWLEK